LEPCLHSDFFPKLNNDRRFTQLPDTLAGTKLKG
jgi:hypothetical protein